MQSILINHDGEPKLELERILRRAYSLPQSPMLALAYALTLLAHANNHSVVANATHGTQHKLKLLILAAFNQLDINHVVGQAETLFLAVETCLEALPTLERLEFLRGNLAAIGIPLTVMVDRWDADKSIITLTLMIGRNSLETD